MPDPPTNSCCNYSDLIEFIHSLQLLCLSFSHSLPVRAGASIDLLGSNMGNAGVPPLGVPPALLCPLSGRRCWEMPNPSRARALPSSGVTPPPAQAQSSRHFTMFACGTCSTFCLEN